MPAQLGQCPYCGAPLPRPTGTTTTVLCAYCKKESAVALSNVEQMQHVFERRERVMPIFERLMNRYSRFLVNGDKPTALLFYEAGTYLMMWISYDTERLADLEPMVIPAMREAAKSLKVPYVPAHERGEEVTWASIDEMLARPAPSLFPSVG